MTATATDNATTGLIGPVALSGGLLLLVASPLMRGGNRPMALIALEIVSLGVLLALWVRFVSAWRSHTIPARLPAAMALLLASPLLVALVQLVPLPPSLWGQLPGHAVYVQALHDIGAPQDAWRPISVSPDATRAALLAGIPIGAAFLLGCLATLRQLRVLLLAVAVLAFAEVLLGLLQISGGQYSPFFFGVMTYGPPVGTFANRNHFGNYLAMALAGYVWLAYEANRRAAAHRERHAFGSSHRAGAWAAGALVLVLGILMSRSRGAALFGLPVAIAALGIVSLRIIGFTRGLRFAVPVTLVLLLASAVLIGFDAVTSRITGDQLASSADFRGLLARSTFDGAMAFWPFGAGWGTYDLAYQRFQPAAVAGYANHAHQDYLEMLFEGGILFVVPALAFAWLAVQRIVLLVRAAWRDRRLDREAMAAALCGLGLLGLLLHSLVEFNMRIPANAILGALLAGAFLRPLAAGQRAHDRPAQPYPAGA
jgi:O-antigen ligase